jgi:hypothetical protein
MRKKCYEYLPATAILREENMNRILLGFIAGIVFGIVDILMMIPLELPDKKVAMLGAFFSRFAIGFLIGASNLPIPAWAQGFIIGLLISIPDAIITKAYAPILIVGVVGGTIIGFVVGRWGA